VDRALQAERKEAEPVDINVEPSAGRDAAERRWEWMRQAWQSARAKLGAAQERMKAQADTKRREVTFKKGDLVLLSTGHLKSLDPSFNRKLSHLYCGPFPVLEAVGDNAYRLDLPKDTMGRVHPTINVSFLREYRDGRSRFPDRPPAPGLSRPPPELIDPAAGVTEPDTYEVQRILAKRGNNYLVKWLGYPYAESTWEAAGKLHNAQKALREFTELQKTLSRPPPSTKVGSASEPQAQPAAAVQQPARRSKRVAALSTTGPRVWSSASSPPISLREWSPVTVSEETQAWLEDFGQADFS
jgi:hypothetical protein